MKTLKATVGSNFLSKVTRLFDSSPQTIIGELVQNSRRAGATNIVFNTVTVEGGTRVVLQDNGRGIADLSTILELSESNWEQDTMHDEDPAGMGLFCLSGLAEPSIVYSHGHKVCLTPDLFTGKEEVRIFPCVTDAGTKISFNLPHDIQQVNQDIERAVKYTGVPRVELNGMVLPSDPLVYGDKILTEDLDLGVRVGLDDGYNYSSCVQYKINFHGIVIRQEVKNETLKDAITLLRNGNRWPEIELLHCRRIKMVLPARNAMVLDEEFDRMERVVLKTIYQCARDTRRVLPYSHFEFARREFGIELTEPTLKDLPRITGFIVPDAKSVLLEDKHSMLRGRHVISEFIGEFQIFLRSKEMKGYRVYDELPRVVLDVTVDGQEVDEVGEVRSSNDIRATLKCGEELMAERQLETLILCEGGTSYFCASEISVFYSPGFNDASALASLITDVVYSSSGDTQDEEEEAEEFEEEAMAWALEELVSAEERIAYKLTNAISPVVSFDSSVQASLETPEGLILTLYIHRDKTDRKLQIRFV